MVMCDVLRVLIYSVALIYPSPLRYQPQPPSLLPSPSFLPSFHLPLINSLSTQIHSQPLLFSSSQPLPLLFLRLFFTSLHSIAVQMFTSLPDRPNLWAPPLAQEDEDDDFISIVLGGDDSEWDDPWPVESKHALVSSTSTPAFTTSSLPSLATSVRTPYASHTLDLPMLSVKPFSADKAVNSKSLTARCSNTTITQAHTTTRTPSEEAVSPALPHRLPLLSSGVRHIAALEVRGQSGLLGGPYIESIVYGDRVVLLTGEAALNVVSCHGRIPCLS